MTLISTLLVLAALLVTARLLVPKISSSVAQGALERDGQRRLADCPGSPNCQGSDASDAARRVPALPMRGSREETMTDLVALIGTQPGARVVTRESDYLHATFESSLMGFIDDVEFLVDETANAVRVRSASRLGHSDLGANARRIAALREAWLARALDD